MNYVGDFAVGQEVYIWFNTFTSDDPSASVTMTNFIDTDVHIHKDDSLTQRNNAAGVAVDVDVDGITGVHKITIQTADNTVANFYEAGHDYAVRIEGVTVDAATLNPIVGMFSIANRRVAGEMCRSSIATLASQTSFTLTAGEASAQDDAYNFCTIIVTDQTTRIQKAIGFISDYTGSTRTVTLIAAPLASGFTMAVGDSVEVLATSAFANMAAWNEVPLDTTNPLPNAAAEAAGGLYTQGSGAGQIQQQSNGKIDANVELLLNDSQSAIDLKDFADAGYDPSVNKVNGVVLVDTTTTNTDLVAASAIADAVFDEAMSGHLTLGTFGQLMAGLAPITGAVNDGSATTIDFAVDGFTEATARHLEGSTVVFTSGALLGQKNMITSYTSQQMNFTKPWTEAPGDNDEFVVLGPASNGIEEMVMPTSIIEAYATALNSRAAYWAFAKLINRVAASGGTLTIYEDDDTTALFTQTLTADASADPIVDANTN